MAVSSFRSPSTKTFVTTAPAVYVLEAKEFAPNIILELFEQDSHRVGQMIDRYQWFALDFEAFTGRILQLIRRSPAITRCSLLRSRAFGFGSNGLTNRRARNEISKAEVWSLFVPRFTPANARPPLRARTLGRGAMAVQNSNALTRNDGCCATCQAGRASAKSNSTDAATCWKTSLTAA